MDQPKYCVNRQLKARCKDAGSHPQKKEALKSQHNLCVTKRREVKLLQAKNQQLQEDNPNKVTAGRLTMKWGIFAKGKTSGIISKGLSPEMQARADANLVRILELANPDSADSSSNQRSSLDDSGASQISARDNCSAQECFRQKNVKHSCRYYNSKNEASTSKQVTTTKRDKPRPKSQTRFAKRRGGSIELGPASQSGVPKPSTSGGGQLFEDVEPRRTSNQEEKRPTVDYQRFLSRIGEKLDESIISLGEGRDVVAETRKNLASIWKKYGSHRDTSVPTSSSSESVVGCSLHAVSYNSTGSPVMSSRVIEKSVTPCSDVPVDTLPSALDFSIHPEQVICSPRLLLARNERKLQREPCRSHDLDRIKEPLAVSVYHDSGVMSHLLEVTAPSNTAIFCQQLTVAQSNDSKNGHDCLKEKKRNVRTSSQFSTVDSNPNLSVALVTPFNKSIPAIEPGTVIVNPLTYLEACTESNLEDKGRRKIVKREKQRRCKLAQFPHEELMKWQRKSEFTDSIANSIEDQPAPLECLISQSVESGWRHGDEDLCRSSSNHHVTFTDRSNEKVQGSIGIPSLPSSSSSEIKCLYRRAMTVQSTVVPVSNTVEISERAVDNGLERIAPTVRDMEIATGQSMPPCGHALDYATLKHCANQNCFSRSSASSTFRGCRGEQFARPPTSDRSQLSDNSGYESSHGGTEFITCECLARQTSLQGYSAIKPYRFESDCNCSSSGDVIQCPSRQYGSATLGHASSRRLATADYCQVSSYVADVPGKMGHCCAQEEFSVPVFPSRDPYDQSNQTYRQRSEEGCRHRCSHGLSRARFSSAPLEQVQVSSCSSQPLLQRCSSGCSAARCDSREKITTLHEVRPPHSMCVSSEDPSHSQSGNTSERPQGSCSGRTQPIVSGCCRPAAESGFCLCCQCVSKGRYPCN